MTTVTKQMTFLKNKELIPRQMNKMSWTRIRMKREQWRELDQKVLKEANVDE